MAERDMEVKLKSVNVSLSGTVLLSKRMCVHSTYRASSKNSALLIIRHPLPND